MKPQETQSKKNINDLSDNKRSKSNKSRTDYKGLQPAILDNLNAEQRKAILHENGPLIVVAGPGTGKTRTLTHRIAYIIKEKIFPPRIFWQLPLQKKQRKRWKIVYAF